MDAFIYNFGRFYLEVENYNNVFSETALRQRGVDLRMGLF
jgi:hypothetical protein